MHKLTRRAQELLKLIIKFYSFRGEPVSSRAVVENTGWSMSAATIRNVMSQLEKDGYLYSPHISAGRIPTAKAYRFFVNSLKKDDIPIRGHVTEQLREILNAHQDNQTLLRMTSSLLAKWTKLAGLVTTPTHSSLSLRHIDFLSLDCDRILVIIVLNEGEVYHQITYSNETYSEQALHEAADHLTNLFFGQELTDICQRLTKPLTQGEAISIPLPIIEIFTASLALYNNQPDFLIEGYNHLFTVAGDQGIDQLRNLFDTMNQKQKLLSLYEECLAAESLHIVIGEESDDLSLGGYSVITAPYCIEGIKVGVLGVIGSTRMAYEEVIPIVNVSAKYLSAALN